MSDRHIKDELAEVAAAAEATRDKDPGPRYRNRRPRQDPSQVYSIRIPVGKLEALRRLAEAKGVPPTALMRSWVVERLTQETEPRPESSAPPMHVESMSPSVVLMYQREQSHAWIHGLTPGGEFRLGLAGYYLRRAKSQ